MTENTSADHKGGRYAQLPDVPAVCRDISYEIRQTFRWVWQWETVTQPGVARYYADGSPVYRYGWAFTRRGAERKAARYDRRLQRQAGYPTYEVMGDALA